MVIIYYHDKYDSPIYYHLFQVTVHATNTEISGNEGVKKISCIDCTLKSKHPTECVLIILTSQLNANERHAVKAHGSAVTPDFCFKSVLFCVCGVQCVWSSVSLTFVFDCRIPSSFLLQV